MIMSRCPSEKRAPKSLFVELSGTENTSDNSDKKPAAEDSTGESDTKPPMAKKQKEG